MAPLCSKLWVQVRVVWGLALNEAEFTGWGLAWPQNTPSPLGATEGHTYMGTPSSLELLFARCGAGCPLSLGLWCSSFLSLFRCLVHAFRHLHKVCQTFGTLLYLCFLLKDSVLLQVFSMWSLGLFHSFRMLGILPIDN